VLYRPFVDFLMKPLGAFFGMGGLSMAISV